MDLYQAQLLLKQNKLSEAETILDKIHSRPAMKMKGICKLKLGKFADALPIYEFLVQKENQENDHIALSAIYTKLQEHDKAVNILYKAIKNNPNNYEIQNHLASKLWTLNRYQEGLNLLLSNSHKYKTCDLWDNLANYAGNMARYDVVELAISNGIKINPDNPKSHLCLADLHCLREEWKQGWKEQEWRVKAFPDYQIYFKRYNPDKLWNKQPLTNKTILVYGEQGYGDIIQNYRFLKYLKDMGASVIFNCPKLLAPLFSENIISVNMAENLPIPQHDYHVLSSSLPHLLDLDKPDGSPYIPKQKNNIQCNKLKVGIVWAGNQNYRMDKQRSIPNQFFNIPDVQLYSLQIPSQKPEFDCINIAENISNFSHTASALSGMDFLISCDTATAHLAGAMGISTLLCLPLSGDTRWGLQDTTPWYNSIKIFRQQQMDNWESVFQEVKNYLKQYIKYENLSAIPRKQR